MNSPDKEPRWIPERAIRAIHDALIKEHGGAYGVLNEGQLSSTLAKPKNLLYYGRDITLYDLAAAYGYGFAKNHCFVDGNKRVALAAVDVFLRMNGFALVADEAEAAAFFLGLASSQENAEEEQVRLSGWIKKHAEKLG